MKLQALGLRIQIVVPCFLCAQVAFAVFLPQGVPLLLCLGFLLLLQLQFVLLVLGLPVDLIQLRGRAVVLGRPEAVLFFQSVKVGVIPLRNVLKQAGILVCLQFRKAGFFAQQAGVGFLGLGLVCAPALQHFVVLCLCNGHPVGLVRDLRRSVLHLLRQQGVLVRAVLVLGLPQLVFAVQHFPGRLVRFQLRLVLFLDLLGRGFLGAGAGGSSGLAAAACWILGILRVFLYICVKVFSG